MELSKLFSTKMLMFENGCFNYFFFPLKTRHTGSIHIMCCTQVLHPQSMRPAREGDIPVRVKNSYNRQAPGTLITKTRDMSKVCGVEIFSSKCEEFHSTDHILHLTVFQAVLTSIVLKQNVTMLDIVSTRMLGQFGFLAKVRNCFFDLILFCHLLPSWLMLVVMLLV